LAGGFIKLLNYLIKNYKHDLFYLWQNMSGAAIAASRKIKIFLIVGAVTG